MVPRSIKAFLFIRRPIPCCLSANRMRKFEAACGSKQYFVVASFKSIFYQHLCGADYGTKLPTGFLEREMIPLWFTIYVSRIVFSFDTVHFIK